MALAQDQRPRFYEGQYLGADDLSAAVGYGRVQAARHALGAHAWGIAVGLQLKENPLPGGAVDVFIMPGYAWDGFGRPLAVLAPLKVAPAPFDALYKYDPVVDKGTKGRLVEVWLRYDETETGPPKPGFGVCDTADQNARVQETYRVEIGPRPSHADRHDPVFVAGQSVDALQALRKLDPAAPLVYDESIPHQTFPDGDIPAWWLIPIGYVRWLPVQNGPGHFVARDDSDPADTDSHKIARFRRNLGVVAESVLASDGALRLRDRSKDPDDPANTGFTKHPVPGFLSKDSSKAYYQPPGPDLVWVEGHLRAEGDVRLTRGRLDLRAADGQDHDTPLQILRSGDAGKTPAQMGGRSLQVLLGPAAQADNRLAVGPLKDDGTLDEKLTVLSGGLVGIGTPAPDRALTVQGPAGTYINVKADGGVHEVLLGADGNGGIVSTMTNHDLQLRAGGNVTRVVIKNDGKVGIGTAAPTLALSVVGDFGRDDGPATLNLWGSRIGDVGGNVLFVRAAAGGNVAFDGVNNRVGIGTNAPATKLQVVGDRIRLGDAGKHVDLRTDGSAVDLHSDTTNLYLRSSGPGGNNRVLVNPFGTDGFVGVGTEFPNVKLHLIGDLTVEGLPRSTTSIFWTLISDEALKQDVQPLSGALDKLLRLRGVSFQWRDAGAVRGRPGPLMGLLAQEVEPVFPEWVGTGPHGYKELTLQGFEAVVIEALRDLKALTDALDSRLKKVEGLSAKAKA
ncbi:MAG TPA: tail fiber domain-containing protein [Armatimonadota bacterium]|jgi:hypothetical protein